VKNLILICIFGCLTFKALPQAKTDSIAYQLERKKINEMLAKRTEKFGQYDASLSQHTGIFGLQTKKDIRRSNNILMDIAKTDDAIFKELKILLEYRAFEQTQVQSQSKDTQNSNIGFMVTINKLRDQNDKLKAEADKLIRQQEKISHRNTVVFILMLVLILFLLTRMRFRKT
jgi:hypothetical protein